MAQAGSRHGSFKGFREHFDRCRLLDSRESLRAPRSTAILTAGRSANESVEYQRSLPDLPEAGLPARGWANTEIGTANEATTRKHDVVLLAQ